MLRDITLGNFGMTGRAHHEEVAEIIVRRVFVNMVYMEVIYLARTAKRTGRTNLLL
jgi:hypothetical protein